VIFTSPRAVEHGLAQLDADVLARASFGAIGPATARALQAAGLPVTVRAEQGYTSEALLDLLARDAQAGPGARRSVFILAAPGGRRHLFDGIVRLGWACRMLMVYRSQPDELDKASLAALEEASAVLSVWTSANAMKALSQRLPPGAWFRLCQGDWLVISERLRRLARAYGPPGIHLAAGPGNSELLAAIRNLA
jgi:uroporphyrinogen-III synthase